MHNHLQRRLDEIGAPADVRELVNQLLEEAVRDPLTGLHNRRFFDVTLAQQIESARRYGRDLTLVLLDLDGFKRVNDTFGHAVGDDLLKNFSRILQQTARKSDVVCRIGGDEFAMIMPETKPSNARTMLDRLFQTLDEWVPRSGRIRVSTGTAALPSDSLFAEADRMLLESKRMKGNSLDR